MIVELEYDLTGEKLEETMAQVEGKDRWRGGGGRSRNLNSGSTGLIEGN